MKVTGLLQRGNERLLVKPTPCFYWKVIPMTVPRTSTAKVREETQPVEPRSRRELAVLLVSIAD